MKASWLLAYSGSSAAALRRRQSVELEQWVSAPDGFL
jgi:hypothetical protein